MAKADKANSGEQEPKQGTPPSDIALVYGVSADGKGYEVLRQRGEQLEAGSIRPLEEGKPLRGSLIRLRSREESPFLFDVDEESLESCEAPRAREERGRPAQVASAPYRKGWDGIWGAKRASGGSSMLN